MAISRRIVIDPKQIIFHVTEKFFSCLQMSDIIACLVCMLSHLLFYLLILVV